MNVRIFISIPIIPEKELSELLNRVKTLKNIRTVSADQIHITLCFIGDVDEKRIGDIEECVSKAVGGYTPSATNLKGAGVFPNRKSPRILWVGVESLISLEKISSSLRNELKMKSVGFDDKPFKAHITVGRVSGTADLSEILREYEDVVFQSMIFDRVYIMKSVLSPSGAKHSTVGTVFLDAN